MPSAPAVTAERGSSSLFGHDDKGAGLSSGEAAVMKSDARVSRPFPMQRLHQFGGFRLACLERDKRGVVPVQPVGILGSRVHRFEYFGNPLSALDDKPPDWPEAVSLRLTDDISRGQYSGANCLVQSIEPRS